MSTHTSSTLRSRWHEFWEHFAEPRRDPAALAFAHLGLLGTRW